MVRRLLRAGATWLLLCLVLASTVDRGRTAGAEFAPIPPTDPRRRAGRLENPRRDKDLKPDEVVAALGLAPGDVVADIGAGPGYFALRFARTVGPTGRVYGVDIEPHFVAELSRRAVAAGLANVVPLLTSPDESGLPAASSDLAFFCSSYRHIDDRVGYLRRLRSRLRPGGRIAILEWRKIADLSGEMRSASRVGPPEEEKIERDQVAGELREAGFKVLESPEILEFHYFLIAGDQG